ncbi:MAG: hypothetical protein O7I42_20805 [Alphaproteobacteria bacterium]|nr:hypothetical protein [Alphaproteobacteria bacterium]
MTEPITLYDMDESAKQLRVCRRVFQDLIKLYPFYRVIGRKKLFTAEDLNEIIRRLPCPYASKREKEAQTSGSAGPSEASLYTRVSRLMTPKPQKKSGSGARPNCSKIVSMEQARRRRG